MNQAMCWYWSIMLMVKKVVNDGQQYAKHPFLPFFFVGFVQLQFCCFRADAGRTSSGGATFVAGHFLGPGVQPWTVLLCWLILSMEKPATTQKIGKRTSQRSYLFWWLSGFSPGALGFEPAATWFMCLGPSIFHAGNPADVSFGFDCLTWYCSLHRCFQLDQGAGRLFCQFGFHEDFLDQNRLGRYNRRRIYCTCVFTPTPIDEIQIIMKYIHLDTLGRSILFGRKLINKKTSYKTTLPWGSL